MQEAEERKKVYLFLVETTQDVIIKQSELEEAIKSIVLDYDPDNELVMTLREQWPEGSSENAKLREEGPAIYLDIRKGNILRKKLFIERVYKRGPEWGNVENCLDDLAAGSGKIADDLSDASLDLHEGTRIIISRAMQYLELDMQGFSTPHALKQGDVWAYNIYKYFEDEPLRIHLSSIRMQHEVRKLDLVSVLEPVFGISHNQFRIGNQSGDDRRKISESMSRRYVSNYIYGQNYLAAMLPLLETGVMTITGVKLSAVTPDKIKDAVDKVQSLYQEIISLAIEYHDTHSASDLLKKAGACIRALYHLGEKIPVEVMESEHHREELDERTDYYELMIKQGDIEYRTVNMSYPDFIRVGAKNVLFIPLEKIPEYGKIFSDVEHKAFVVDFKK